MERKPVVNSLTRGQSVDAALDGSSVDRMNAEFYGHIQYPGAVMRVERFAQPDLFAVMLGHDIGYFDGPNVLADRARIWVAGCGRNQALITALRFPACSVLGSDLSETSLATCRAYADQLGVENLELRRESINETTYVAEFDYVLCTGVIMINADPAVPLTRLSRAMKPAGVLELMVYNEYHRFHTAAFQQVVRALVGNEAAPDYLRELPLAKRLAASFDTPSSMASFLKAYNGDDVKEAYFADSLLQPVERSYTVRTLKDLTRSCGLELLTFCIDQFSKGRNAVSWNVDLRDMELRAKYLALPDSTRWHITNLMLQEVSPMLWFYLQREDCPRPRRAEQQICADFLDHSFARVNTTEQAYLLNARGAYEPLQRMTYPGRRVPRSGNAQKVYMALDEHKPMRDVFDQLQIDTSFYSVNDVRVRLSTSAFPFIQSVTECG
jgi:SAM-dependent methyltransferase